MSNRSTAEALANEIYRHEQTKKSLANAEATVKKLNDELAELHSFIDGFQAERDSLQEQITELEDTIRDNLNTIQRQDARILELETDATSRIAELEDLQRKLIQHEADLNDFQKELKEAREETAARDKKLNRANMEKKRLKKTSSQAGNHLQDTVAVVGETVLNLNAEVERIMAALKDMGMADVPAPDVRCKVEV